MNKTITAILFILTSFTGSTQVKMQRIEGGILFTEDNQKILLFQIDPKSRNGEYERCNYIHPLWGLNGAVLTEDFPEDHPYHRGVFWAWHQLYIDGDRIGDGWALENFSQKVAEVEYSRESDGTAELKTEVLWNSDLWKQNGIEVPYLRENTTIRIHPLTNNYRKIEFEIRLLALVENLEIGGSEDEKGYGGFSVRMVTPGDISFRGKDGKVQPQNEAVQSPGFINIYGPKLSNKKHGGIVIIDHPENIGYPQSWLLSSGMGLQNVLFPESRLVSVSTKEPLVLRYTLIVYSGRMSDKKITALTRQ